MKQLWNVLAVTALLAMVASGAFAQRYSPPGGGTSGGSSSGGGDTGGSTGGGGGGTETPAQSNPDPFGLTLAASGAAAAVGYVMRRKRDAS